MVAKSHIDSGPHKECEMARTKVQVSTTLLTLRENIHSEYLDEEVYGPWMVVTQRKHGGRNNKRGSGSTSPRAIYNSANFQEKGAPPKTNPTVMITSKEGKKKVGVPEVGPEEPIKMGSVSNSPAKNAIANPNL